MLNIKTLSFAQWCQVQSFKNTWCVMNETTFLRYSYYIYNIQYLYILHPHFIQFSFIYKTPFCTLDLPRIKWSSMLIYIYCHNQSLGREKIVFICSYYTHILLLVPSTSYVYKQRWGIRHIIFKSLYVKFNWIFVAPFLWL